MRRLREGQVLGLHGAGAVSSWGPGPGHPDPSGEEGGRRQGSQVSNVTFGFSCSVLPFLFLPNLRPHVGSQPRVRRVLGKKRGQGVGGRWQGQVGQRSLLPTLGRPRGYEGLGSQRLQGWGARAGDLRVYEK